MQYKIGELIEIDGVKDLKVIYIQALSWIVTKENKTYRINPYKGLEELNNDRYE